MDNGSAVEYWEKYSEHAFSDTESSVYISVILMSPTYRPVPCSFCFTIKRDIFDLPSVVVGNVSIKDTGKYLTISYIMDCTVPAYPKR